MGHRFAVCAGWTLPLAVVVFDDNLANLLD